MKRLLRSFGHGFRGLRTTARSERNMVIHLVATVLIAGAAWYLQITRVEWALVLACCGGVISLECLNTAIERLADRVTDQHDALIGACKDAAAAAVLVGSITSLTIGGLVFLPRLWALVA